MNPPIRMVVRGASLVMVFLLSACPAPPAEVDAGTEANACDVNARSVCCQGGCSGDTGVQQTCVAGSWTCPQGSVALADCPGRTPSDFCHSAALDGGCGGPPPFQCCVGGCGASTVHSPSCDLGYWSCQPSETASDTCDAGTLCLAAADDDGGCSLSGDLAFPVQTCVTVYAGTLPDGGKDPGYVQVGYVLGADRPAVCQGQPITQPTTVFNLSVGTDGGPVMPGTYAIDNGSAVSPSGGVGILFGRALPNGSVELISQESSGTITFDAVDFTGTHGHFSAVLVLADGGTSPMAGIFNAPACP